MGGDFEGGGGEGGETVRAVLQNKRHGTARVGGQLKTKPDRVGFALRRSACASARAP